MPGSAISSDRGGGAAAAARRQPIGAEYVGNGRTHVRAWAPASKSVAVVVGQRSTPLAAEAGGYFSGFFDGAPGDRYGLRLTTGDRLYPDPASRYQPEGPHGPSEIVDPAAFPWSDAGWRGAALDGQVVYELHVGTFTPARTLDAATREVPELARVGITLIEVMPVAEFDGRFGWGYDGVDLFAPTHLYGPPDAFRRFVDRAHAVGVGVILDVVYNHFGPSGNYLRSFSPAYFSTKYQSEWGEAINFDGEDAAPVREFFVANAAYWIEEFHLDGLRLDATQQIYDESAEHILTAIGRAARAAARGRSIVLVAENEPQETKLVRPIAEGGYGLDALWNDDFHHSAMVALTGRAEAYYCDTRGEPQELVSAAKFGYLFQGQHYAWQHQPRGTPAWGLRPAQFVTFLQNHDQVANSGRGLRGHELTSPGRWRAMTALLLLMPSTPMLFQGQEFAASAPFLYFADFDPDLNAAIRKGRAEFLTQFPSVADLIARGIFADPSDPATFERSTLDLAERERHAEIYRLHEDLLRIRRDDPAIGRPRAPGIDGAVLAPQTFVLRFFGEEHRDDRVLIVNLGVDLDRPSFPEPLLAPPAGHDWAVRWSSDDPRYGGSGLPQLWPRSTWHIPGESAVLLTAGAQRERPPRVQRRTA